MAPVAHPGYSCLELTLWVVDNLYRFYHPKTDPLS